VASAAASSICSSAMLIRQVGIQGTPNPGAEAMQRDTTNRSLNERKERERERAGCVAHVRSGPETAGVTKGEVEAREAEESRAAWMEDGAGGGGGGDGSGRGGPELGSGGGAARWW
jgi:hypothetical protein